MPDRLPVRTSQSDIVRALVRLGGTWDKSHGKGSHEGVRMPNGYTAIIPYRGMSRSMLTTSLRLADISIDDFMNAL